MLLFWAHQKGGGDEAAAAAAIGPITSQVIFQAGKTTGDLTGQETLGIFKERTDKGGF